VKCNIKLKIFAKIFWADPFVLVWGVFPVLANHKFGMTKLKPYHEILAKFETE